MGLYRYRGINFQPASPLEACLSHPSRPCVSMLATLSTLRPTRLQSFTLPPSQDWNTTCPKKVSCVYIEGPTNICPLYLVSKCLPLGSVIYPESVSSNNSVTHAWLAYSSLSLSGPIHSRIMLQPPACHWAPPPSRPPSPRRPRRRSASSRPQCRGRPGETAPASRRRAATPAAS